MCPVKMAALRLAALGLCLGAAAAAVPLVIWHGMGEPGRGGGGPVLRERLCGRRGPRAGPPAGPGAARRSPRGPPRCPSPPERGLGGDGEALTRFPRALVCAGSSWPRGSRGFVVCLWGRGEVRRGQGGV